MVVKSFKRPAAKRRTTASKRKAGKLSGATLAVVGTSPDRIDGAAKAKGRTQYVADLQIRDALVGFLVTSPLPHARIRRLDVSAARSMKGVHAVLTAADVPGQNQIGAVLADQPLLASERALSLGDRLALIAADTREEAEAAAAAIQIELDPLPGVFDPLQALTPSAPALHDGGNLAAKMVVRKGELQQAERQADLVIERTYTTGMQEHAYLETNGILAEPQSDGSMLLSGSMQCPFYVQKAVARVLGVAHSMVRVVQLPTGGGFGGKEDFPSEPAACAALLAHATGRPVRIVLRRHEDMAWSTKRHATVVKHKLFAKKDGTLLGLRAEIYFDAGAYVGLSSIVAERGNASAAGPYLIPHVEVDTYTVYTNNPFGGAFRGFGQPQVTFALESQMDLLAQELGRDPLELREQNMVRAGSKNASGEKLAAPLALETLALARRRSSWAKKRAAAERHNESRPELRRGVGAASMSYGCCLHAGGQHLEGSASLVQVHPDASVSVTIGGTEIGQGAFTAMAQIAAETLGVPYENVRVTPTDTAAVPDSGPTVASRTTIMSGNAVHDACRQIRDRMLPVAAEKLGVPKAKVEIKNGAVLVAGRKRLQTAALIAECYTRKVNLTATGWYAPARKSWDKSTGHGQAYSVYCYGTTVAEVSLDTVTGLVRVDRITTVHDVGKSIFAAGVEGQIQGGVLQGIGYATMENLVIREGRILNPNFTDYLIPTSLDIPEIDIALIEEPYEDGPFGAKGIGEPSLIPVAAAVANAVAHALGSRLTALPLTPERVKMALLADEASRLKAPA